MAEGEREGIWQEGDKTVVHASCGTMLWVAAVSIGMLLLTVALFWLCSWL